MPFKTVSVEATMQLAARFASQLQAGDVVALSGELGAGKTHFVKGLAAGSGIAPGQWVSSPSFSLINQYAGPTTVYHFDLYRLESLAELQDIGFFDYLDATQPGLVVVEWADRFDITFPPGTFYVSINYENDGERSIAISVKVKRPERSLAWLETL